MAVLLLVLTLLLFEVLAPDADWARAIAVALAGGALMVAVATSRAHANVRRARTLAVGGGALVVVVGIATGILSAEVAFFVGTLLTACVPVALVGGLLRLIREEGVTAQAVAGALAIYLLSAWHSPPDRLRGGRPERHIFHSARPRDFGDRVYYSFTVLTTTGFGDYTTATPAGHALAVLEMLTGQLYLVTVIGIVIGNFAGGEDELERSRQQCAAKPSGRPRPSVAGPERAGWTAGTAALTLAYWPSDGSPQPSRPARLRRLARARQDRRLDHAPPARHRPRGPRLGLILRWSYGSAFGLWHGTLHRRFAEPWASAIFGGTLMSATLSLFPLLGRTPPPWRWPADVMATCPWALTSPTWSRWPPSTIACAGSVADPCRCAISSSRPTPRPADQPDGVKTPPVGPGPHRQRDRERHRRSCRRLVSRRTTAGGSGRDDAQ